MSREIKFRGKDIRNNKWVYGGYYKHLKRTPSPIGDSIKECDYEHLIIKSGFSDWNMPKPLECFIVEEKTVGEYTGLKDKNGKEIYEGDIIEGGYLNPLTSKFLSRKYVVEYDKGSFKGKLIGHTPYGDTWLQFIEGEVIGNIYEDKYLLGVENE